MSFTVVVDPGVTEVVADMATPIVLQEGNVGAIVAVNAVTQLPVVVPPPTVIPTVIGGFGPPGPPGPPGAPGSGAEATFVWQQLTPSSTWTIVHNLGGYPAVTTVDSAGAEMHGDVAWPDTATVLVTFAYPEGGQAFLNM